MAKNDVTIVDSTGGVVREFRVDDRTTSGASATIKPGEPVKKSGNFVVLLATGDPEIGTDEFVGIAVDESTETSSADGVVNVFVPAPGKSVMRCKATTTTNIDTDDELEGVLQDCVTFDLTGTTFTVDENEGDDPNVHGLQIVDGDISKGTLDFVVQQNAGHGGGTVGQTRD